jgi:hypothetical protein
VLGAAALLAVAVLVIVLVSGSGGQAPASGAASLVPTDALVYVHLSTDPRRPAVKRANALARRFPDYPQLAGAVTARLTAILGGGVPLDFAHQVRPRLGKEAAFAVLNTAGASAGSLIVLDLRRGGPLFATGAVRTGSYRGVQLYRNQGGTELAFLSHYLAVGQDASVRAAIDVATGHRRSLAASSAYPAAAGGEPEARVLDAYISPGGLARLLAPRGGPSAAIALLLSQPGFRGATVSISPAARGAAIRVHTALAADASRARPASFTPTLSGWAPGRSALMLDVGDLANAAPSVLATTAVLGVFNQLGPLLARLGAALSAEGVNVGRVVSIFHNEGAVAIGTNGGAPTVIVISRTHAPRAARETLGALEAPLAQLFQPTGTGPGQVPEWNDEQAGGVAVRQFAFAPGLQLDYAVFDGLVVISTSLRGIADVAARSRPLATDAAFTSAFPGRPDRVGSLLFLDFSQLLSLGERAGLAHSPHLLRLRPDLDRIRALGSSSTSGEADTTAELFLEIP